MLELVAGTDVTVSGELIDYLIFTFTGDGYDCLKENNFICFMQNSILLSLAELVQFYLSVYVVFCLC